MSDPATFLMRGRITSEDIEVSVEVRNIDSKINGNDAYHMLGVRFTTPFNFTYTLKPTRDVLLYTQDFDWFGYDEDGDTFCIKYENGYGNSYMGVGCAREFWCYLIEELGYERKV